MGIFAWQSIGTSDPRANKGMIVEWSLPAAADIRSLYRFLDQRSPKAATRIAQMVVLTVNRTLSRNPMLGHPGRVHETRELVVPKTPYIVPYRVRLGRIQILRVFHHSQPWPDQL
jgi:toxin ParE1/3/4